MKLRDFLIAHYKQHPMITEELMYKLIKTDYKSLSWLCSTNKELKTEGILGFSEERDAYLTGQEIIEKGIYLLYANAHDGFTWVVDYDSIEEANEDANKWNEIQFNSYDYASLVIIE